MTKRWIHVALLLSCAGPAMPAPDPDGRFSLSAAPSGALSYTGINTYFLLRLRYGQHELYAGPKLALSKSYLPGSGVWGYNAGYYVSILKSPHLEMLANADVQEIRYRPYSLLRGPSANRNTISEFLGGLALRYRPWPAVPFSMQTDVAEGLYRDKYYSLSRNESAVNYGVSSMIRFSLIYRIFER